MTLADLQNGVSNLSNNLIKLNKTLVSAKLSKGKNSLIQNQIKDIKNQIDEKKQKISLILKQPFKMNIADEEDTSSTAEFFGISQEIDDMPKQDLQEVTVTANRTDYFINKYKFYIIGALVLLFIMFKKK
jgi:hypothetical protein